MHAICPAQLSALDLIALQSTKFLIRNNFFRPTVTPPPAGPNILVTTLLYNTLILCSPLWARDKVSCPYKPTNRKT
jgi:hypothetical protein